MSGMALATLGSNLVTAASSVDWQTALETFLNTLSSPRTRRAYKRAVEEATRAMNVDLVAELTRPMLAQYRAGLVARLKADRADRLSPATVSLKLAGLRSFLHFCRLTGVIVLGKDVIAFVLKSPKAKVQKPYAVLSEPERRRLLSVAQSSRDRALVSLALGAGLRVSELVNVRLGDFSQDNGGSWWLLIKQGKGRKDRLVPVASPVMLDVRVWVRAGGRSLGRRMDRDSYLLNTRQSSRMTTARAWQVVKTMAQEVGIEKPISPHSLRHTMAIETLRAGAEPVIVQKLLGHASLSTTQRYIDHLERADLGKWAFSPT